MTALEFQSAENILRNYFHAKDENRPHLLERVFTKAATLEVVNSSTSIAFPAVTVGREGIAEVLVRSFNQTYENIYSFYLGRPSGRPPEFECDWLVVMTEKGAARGVRVGCGRYRWEFEVSPPNLARRLSINIQEMQVLPALAEIGLFSNLERLSYPWTSPGEVAELASINPMFEFVPRCLGAR